MDRNGAQQHLEVSCGGSDLARLLCLTRCCLQMVAVFIESSCPVSGPRPCDSCRSRVQLSIVSSSLKNNFQLLLRTQNLFFGILADQFMPRRQSSPPIHGGWRQRVLSLVEGLCWEGQDSKAKRHSFNLLAVGHRVNQDFLLPPAAGQNMQWQGMCCGQQCHLVVIACTTNCKTGGLAENWEKLWRVWSSADSRVPLGQTIGKNGFLPGFLP